MARLAPSPPTSLPRIQESGETDTRPSPPAPPVSRERSSAMRVAVFGLWHLGCVTAACLARLGHHVVGLDPDAKVVADLRQGKPPLHEPGLPELIHEGTVGGRLSFTSDPAELRDVDVLWVAVD